MAENVGIMADFVDEYPLYLPLPAAHFLIAFLSVLCALCGKKVFAAVYGGECHGLNLSAR